MYMPLDSHHRISIQPRKQKSSQEKIHVEKTIQERVRAILNKEKREESRKVREETRGQLRDLLQQIKPKNTLQEASREKRWDEKSELSYQWIGLVWAKTTDGTAKMKVFWPKFGNEKVKIGLGAMYASEQDIPWGESHGSLGIGLNGSIEFS